jgi:hypothetical protein
MFDNPFSMVVAIVFITAVASVLRARYGYSRKARRGEPMVIADADSARMRDEIKQLKDRIAVLERLATDHNSTATLDREIEKLR